MNSIAVNITKVKNVKNGDEVILIGKQGEKESPWLLFKSPPTQQV